MASRTVGVGQPRKTTAGEARKTRNVQNRLNKLGVTNVQQAKLDRAVSRNKQIDKTAAGRGELGVARNYVGNTAPTKTNRQTVQRRAEQGTLAKENIITKIRELTKSADIIYFATDPTGAGDSFAGAMIGYLASKKTTKISEIKNYKRRT